MGKIFGLDIDIIDNDANLTGDQARAKGWYDTETGKITVVLPKNNGIADTVRTTSKPPKPSKPLHHERTPERHHAITKSRHR